MQDPGKGKIQSGKIVSPNNLGFLTLRRQVFYTQKFGKGTQYASNVRTKITEELVSGIGAYRSNQTLEGIL